MTDRRWLITGASRGLGREFLRIALEAGDRVVALSRSTPELDPGEDADRVLALPVDVTDRAAVFAAVERATAEWGGLDVVVNNAGVMSMGFVEEFSEQQARDQLELNFFGALWVSQAVLPVFRAGGGGRLIQISSIGGVGGFPNTGLYSASKFALEGLSEAIALEAAQFSVRTTIVEPGGYWTDLYTEMPTADPLPAYEELRAQIAEQFAEGSSDSDPRLAAEAVLKLVDSDDPPRRLILGGSMFDVAIELTEEKLRTWRSWESVSRAAEKAIPDPRG